MVQTDGPTIHQMAAMLTSAIEEEEQALASMHDEREALDARIAEATQRLTMFRRTLRVLEADLQRDRTAAIHGRGAVKRAVRDMLIRESPHFVHADDVLNELQRLGFALSEKDPKATVVTAMLRMARERERLGATEGVERKPGNLFRWVGKQDSVADAERSPTPAG